MLKIVLFAYSKGFTSNREIAWQCEPNTVFKALSCDLNPHFTTIAALESGHPETISSIFEQVLVICDQQGLSGREVIAIDGLKVLHKYIFLANPFPLDYFGPGQPGKVVMAHTSF